MTEVYYIEDDKDIAIIVEEYLNQKGYGVSVFRTLEDGLFFGVGTGKW